MSAILTGWCRLLCFRLYLWGGPRSINSRFSHYYSFLFKIFTDSSSSSCTPLHNTQWIIFPTESSLFFIYLKRDKYLALARELKKTMGHESRGNANCIWCTRYSHQKIGTGIGGLGNKRTRRNHPNYDIIKIHQNTEKSPGDLKRLAITQTPVKNHQQTLVGKTLKGVE